MKNLFKNLQNYHDKNLKLVNVNGRGYRTYPDFNPNVIIGMAFGANYDEKSYKNKLAKAIVDSREFFGKELAVIVQKEIGECLRRIGEKKFYFVGENYEEGEKSLLFSKIDTNLILGYCKDIMKKERLQNKAVYVAHPAHVYRVMKTGENKGIEGFPFIPEKTNWLNDSQIWVRSPLFWIPREILTRIIKL